jgi:hypothetical protein
MRGSKPGERRGGRSKGTPNKTTGALKEAILLAAEQTGSDGKGEGGLIGYLKRVAHTDIKAFAGLLGRVLPMQVAGDPDNPVVVAGEIRLIGVRPPGLPP